MCAASMEALLVLQLTAELGCCTGTRHPQWHAVLMLPPLLALQQCCQ
jgi:hypothetical protein